MSGYFGNKQLTDKMVERFGSAGTVKVDLKYTDQVQAFIRKVEQAKENTAKSTLVF